MATILRIFDQVGLDKTFGKTKSMTCTPGFVWEGWGRRHISGGWRRGGGGGTFQERKRTQVSYVNCGKTMEASSL